MKHFTIRKLMTIALLVVMTATLMGCGKVAGKSRKNYTGFYLKETTKGEYDRSIAFTVDKDGNVIYMVSKDISHRATSHSGYLEPTDDGADIFLQTQYRSNGNVDGASSYAKYCPLHVYFSEDGTKLYLSSDSENFSAAVFDVVKEDYFWDFVRNYIRYYEFIIPGEGTAKSVSADEEHTDTETAANEAVAEEAAEAPAALSKEEEQVNSAICELYLVAEQEASAALETEDGELLEGREALRYEMEHNGIFGDPMDRLLAAHMDEILANGIDETTWRYNGDLAPLAEEYKRLSETAEAEAAAAEAAAAAASLGNALSSINITGDTTLFDEDGVTFTFEGVQSDDNGYFSEAAFKVVNNNPDNKKVFINMKNISVNGFTWGKGNGVISGVSGGSLNEISGVEAGKTFNGTVGSLENKKYEEQLAWLNESVATFPVMSIDFCFEVKIGTNGEKRLCTRSVKTASYDSEKIASAYGRRVATVSLAGAGIDVFVKETENGTAVVLTGNNEAPMDLRHCEMILNSREHLYTSRYSDTLYPGCALVIHNGDSEDGLRKSHEIGNAEPFEIKLELQSDAENAEVTLISKH